MGCGTRRKASEIRADQKWDFISLSDFKSANCLSIFAYIYLLGSLLVSIAVYGVDTFTAVNLLAYGKWAGKINPSKTVSFEVTKYVFSICIILSWANLAYEYMRALRVMNRGAVVESYLDSLAVRLQCVRWTKSGRGWRRFLVFAELTKSKKGAEYVALFSYFALQAWVRIIFCQGPRQVINALTLYDLLKNQLIPTGDNNVGSAIGNFFQKLGKVAENDYQSAIIYSGMLFTLVVWVFGAISLILAVIFWITFLWYYCPQSQGGLFGYCEKKTNKRLAAIVSVKVNKALEEEERKRRKADAKAIKKGEQPRYGRQATLPTLFNPTDSEKDKLPAMPMLNRTETSATLPTYTSRPTTPGNVPTTATFEMSDLEKKRPLPGRSITGSSYASNAPLIGNASDMGYGRPESPAPSLPASRAGMPPPIRSMTGSSQRSQWSQPRTPMEDRGYTASPVSYANQPSMPSHMSNFGNGSQASSNSLNQQYPNPNERSYTPAGLAPSMGRRTPFNDNSSQVGGAMPYPMDSDDGPLIPQRPGEFGRSSPALSALGQGQKQQYQAYNPQNRAAPSASPAPYPASPPRDQQMRSATEPGRPGDYYNSSRPSTAQSNRPPRGPPPQDYFGDARPGTSQSNRPPPMPMQSSYGEGRPGTAQSNRLPPQQRKPSQDNYFNERSNTPLSARSQPPGNYGDVPALPTPVARRPTPQGYGEQISRPGTAQSSMSQGQGRRPVGGGQQQQSMGQRQRSGQQEEIKSPLGDRQPRLPDLF